MIRKRIPALPLLRVLTTAAVIILAGFPAEAKVTTRGDTGLLFTAGAGRYRLVETEQGGRAFRRVEMFGARRTGETGRPDLPVNGYWIAVPEGHTARARIVRADFDDFPFLFSNGL